MKLFFFFATLLIAINGNSCSCFALGKIDNQQYNLYDLIISGQVVSVSKSRFEKKIVINVNTYYKGENIKCVITVLSPIDEAECGISPKIGENWLVFAFVNGKNFKTNLCTRTKNMNPKALGYNKKNIEEDLYFLKSKKQML